MINIFTILKNKCLYILSVVFITSSCAYTVPLYQDKSSPRLHFPYEPESLSCV